MNTLVTLLGASIFSLTLIFTMYLLFILGRHVYYQYGCSKVTGRYGEYVYFVKVYGFSHVKLSFSKKKNILGLKLWWKPLYFGATCSMSYYNETMTPVELTSWINSSLSKYESHIETWSKL